MIMNVYKFENENGVIGSIASFEGPAYAANEFLRGLGGEKYRVVAQWTREMRYIGTGRAGLRTVKRNRPIGPQRAKKPRRKV